MAEMLVSWPVCTVHGTMRHRERFWECNGYDGEGCPSMITDDELSDHLSNGAPIPRGTIEVITTRLDGEGSLDIYPPAVLMRLWLP